MRLVRCHVLGSVVGGCAPNSSVKRKVADCVGFSCSGPGRESQNVLHRRSKRRLVPLKYASHSSAWTCLHWWRAHPEPHHALSSAPRLFLLCCISLCSAPLPILDFFFRSIQNAQTHHFTYLVPPLFCFVSMQCSLLFLPSVLQFAKLRLCHCTQPHCPVSVMKWLEWDADQLGVVWATATGFGHVLSSSLPPLSLSLSPCVPSQRWAVYDAGQAAVIVLQPGA